MAMASVKSQQIRIVEAVVNESSSRKGDCIRHPEYRKDGTLAHAVCVQLVQAELVQFQLGSLLACMLRFPATPGCSTFVHCANATTSQGSFARFSKRGEARMALARSKGNG